MHANIDLSFDISRSAELRWHSSTNLLQKLHAAGSGRRSATICYSAALLLYPNFGETSETAVVAAQ